MTEGFVASHGNAQQPGDPRSRLNRLRRAALRRVAGLASDFDAIVEAASDAAADDEHDPEGHTIAWERQQIASLLEEAQLTLNRVEAAEQRLAEGHYGICTACGDKIAVERLEALPATPTCINCAQRRCTGPTQRTRR